MTHAVFAVSAIHHKENDVDNNVQKPKKDYYVIDITLILRAMWKKAWLIAIAAILCGGIGFSVSAFLINPTYSASIMLYVNNSSNKNENPNFTISSSEISAAQSLVRTYSEILKSRTTLNKIIEETGVEYSHKDLAKMISAKPANDTEIMKVTVTSEDPYEAARIANCISEILPVRISEIIDGATMNVVENAVPDTKKIAPSITKYTAMGIMLGVVIMSLYIIVKTLMDDTIHDEEFLTQNYNIPILARIPDLTEAGGKKHSYYYQSKQGIDYRGMSPDMSSENKNENVK
jgi:capsular polysaccharide biosynthesis protein